MLSYEPLVLTLTLTLLSYEWLHRIFQPHAPMEVWLLGPGNLKQLITQWYKSHPAFVGLKEGAWIKRLTDTDPEAPPSSQVTKFSFEYTPSMGARESW